MLDKALNEGFALIRRVKLVEAEEKFKKALDEGSDVSWSYFGLGEVYRDMSQPQKAIAMYGKAIELNPHNIKALAFQAIMLFSLNNISESEECMRQIGDLSSADAYDYTAIGFYYFLQKDLAKSREYYDLALNKDSDFALAYFLKARTEAQPKDALKLYRAAINKDPQFVLAHMGEAQSQLLIPNKSEQALKAYNKALEHNQSYIVGYFEQAELLVRLNRYKEALEVYQKVIDQEPAFLFPIPYLKKAEISLKLGRSEVAKKTYQEVLEKDPNFAPAKAGIAGILEAQGKIAAAQKYMKEFTTDVNTQALLSNGQALMTIGKVKEAIECFDNIFLSKAKLTPVLHTAILCNKGDALYALREYTKAVECYTAALNKDKTVPYRKAIFCRQGNSFLASKQFEKAKESYEEALKIDENYIDALNNLGKVLHALGKNEEAMKYYERVLAIDPIYVQALHNMAIVLQSLKRYDEAIAFYDAALKIAPNFTPATINKLAALLHLEREKTSSTLPPSYASEIARTDSGNESVVNNLPLNSRSIEEWSKSIGAILPNYEETIKDIAAQAVSKFSSDPERALDNAVKLLELLSGEQYWQQEVVLELCNALAQIMQSFPETRAEVLKKAVEYLQNNEDSYIRYLFCTLVNNKDYPEIITSIEELIIKLKDDDNESVILARAMVEKALNKDKTPEESKPPKVDTINFSVTYEDLKNFKESILSNPVKFITSFIKKHKQEGVNSIEAVLSLFLDTAILFEDIEVIKYILASAADPINLLTTNESNNLSPIIYTLNSENSIIHGLISEYIETNITPEDSKPEYTEKNYEDLYNILAHPTESLPDPIQTLNVYIRPLYNVSILESLEQLSVEISGGVIC